MTTTKLGTLCLLSVICLSLGYMADYPGPYCEIRPGGCCDDRRDICSVPISSNYLWIFFFSIPLYNVNWLSCFFLSIIEMSRFLFFFFFSIPKATLCYCDAFCDRAVNGDCCPDYESFCLGIEAPPNITTKCFHNGIWFGQFDAPIKDNCNLWWVSVKFHVFLTKWREFFVRN